MEKGASFWQKCGHIFSRYIGCNLLDAVIVGGANALFLYVMGMPHILLISLTAGLLNMIPTFGPVIGAVLGAALLLFGKPLNALWFLLFTVVLQLADGYLLKPKLFGNSLGVPSAVVLLATLIGGRLFGILGVLLAIPAAAIALMALRRRNAKTENADMPPGEPGDREDPAP